MNYVLIAVFCAGLTGNCEVDVIDHGLTKSDCEQAQPIDSENVRYDCEIEGVNWEGEKW